MTIDIINNNTLREKLYYDSLDNGLDIFLVPKKEYTKKYAVFATNYGSKDNKFVPIGKKEPLKVPDGIAHFLEHKLFEQAEGNIFNEFSKLGSFVNAYTNFDQTAYLFSCTDYFYDNLKLLIKFVQTPYFTDENVEKEKGIIEQEIKMYQDNPEWKVFFNCLRGMYVKNSVRTDIAGTVDSINKINKDTLYQCYNTFYHPNNMAVFMVGDIKFDKALEIISQNIRKDVEVFTGQINKINGSEPDLINQKLIEESLSVSTKLFNIGYKDIDLGYDGERLIKKQIITTILLDIILGQSSEFYQKLYDDGLINNRFGSQYIGRKSYGHTIIGGESEKPDEIVKRIQDYFNNLRNKGISEESFIRSKRKLIGYHLMDFNSLEYIANNFIIYHFERSSLMDYLKILQSINIQDVNKRFDMHFKDDNFAVSIINPN